MKHENKIVKNIQYNCKPLFKHIKSKTKIRPPPKKTNKQNKKTIVLEKKTNMIKQVN